MSLRVVYFYRTSITSCRKFERQICFSLFVQLSQHYHCVIFSLWPNQHSPGSNTFMGFDRQPKKLREDNVSKHVCQSVILSTGCGGGRGCSHVAIIHDALHLTIQPLQGPAPWTWNSPPPHTPRMARPPLSAHGTSQCREVLDPPRIRLIVVHTEWTRMFWLMFFVPLCEWHHQLQYDTSVC